VGRRASVDTVERRNISLPCGNATRVRHPIAQLLYRLICIVVITFQRSPDAVVSLSGRFCERERPGDNTNLM
jgi:hypothetical protein